VPWIDLTRADIEPVVFRETVELPPDSGGEDVVSVSPVELSGSVERSGKGYHLAGEARGAVQLRCVRCLTEFGFEFGERFAIQLSPADSAPQDEETRLGRDDLDTRFYAEPRTDLEELAAEQLALAMPVKPLCRADCRGLCPRCGANLNLGPCGCPEQRSDDRFAPLLEWRPSE